jgi:hypothetical protein
MTILHNPINFIILTSGCHSLSDALDIHEIAKDVYNRNLNWVNCNTGKPVSIGRCKSNNPNPRLKPERFLDTTRKSKYSKHPKPNPIPKSYQPTHNNR